jgi:hypothetical protein
VTLRGHGDLDAQQKVTVLVLEDVKDIVLEADDVLEDLRLEGFDLPNHKEWCEVIAGYLRRNRSYNKAKQKVLNMQSWSPSGGFGTADDAGWPMMQNGR